MQQYRDGDLLFTKIGPLGPFSNNSYIIADARTNDALVIDAPAESERVAEAIGDLKVRQIVITHRHGDHWSGLDVLVQKTGAPVYCHEADRAPYEGKVAGTVADGEELSVGGLRVRIIHTPGHTPGSICLLVGERLVSGDTLFPGGPGRTQRPEHLQEEIESIKTRLYTLPDSLKVHPGHGDDTDIGASKAEYAVFAAKQHPVELCGDVTWAAS